MYKEILQIIAIISIIGVGLYPLLSKRNKPWTWYIKSNLCIYVVYTIGVFVVIALHLN